MIKRLDLILPALAIMLLGLAANSFAGTGGTEFALVETALIDWAQGGLGRALAVGIFLVGAGVGMARQSLMSIATGLGGGLAMFYMPDVLVSIVSAMIV